MRNVTVVPRYTPDEAERRFRGISPTYRDAREQDFTFIRGEDYCCRTPEGKLVAMLLTDVFDADEQQERYDIFSQVDGDPSNRPEIFGRGFRLPRVRKDGKTSARVGVPKIVMKIAGQADPIGPYRYRHKAAGKIDCRLTSWTTRHPKLYFAAVRIAARVSEIYKEALPAEYEVQMRYINTVPKLWRVPGSAFTSLYAIKNHPTAYHTDDFDLPTATGVITTAGRFVGCELCLPQFGLALDVQPSDILFVDVHQLHGNLPKRDGQRVSQVYFVRRGMHECGDGTLIPPFISGDQSEALAFAEEESPADEEKETE